MADETPEVPAEPEEEEAPPIPEPPSEMHDKSGELTGSPENSAELLEEFEPVPYVFLLKDALGQDLSLSPNNLTNAQMECPAFHVLLDHLIAVLWSFYSKKHELLGTTQVHWALKILEGTKDRHGIYSADVARAIDDLQDAYMDICSKIDPNEVSNREYSSVLESTRINLNTSAKEKVQSLDSYAEFEMSLRNRDPNSTKTSNKAEPAPPQTGSYDVFEAGIQHQKRQDRYNASQKIDISSIHLADMLQKAESAVIEELLGSGSTMEYETAIDETPPKVSFRPQEEDSRLRQQVMLSERSNKFRDLDELLQEIKRIDDQLESMRKESESKLANQLKNIAED